MCLGILGSSMKHAHNSNLHAIYGPMHRCHADKEKDTSDVSAGCRITHHSCSVDSCLLSTKLQIYVARQRADVRLVMCADRPDLYPPPGGDVCCAEACLWVQGFPMSVPEAGVSAECNRYGKVEEIVRGPPGSSDVAYAVFSSVR
jgi:hypothetical protein